MDSRLRTLAPMSWGSRVSRASRYESRWTRDGNPDVLTQHGLRFRNTAFRILFPLGRLNDIMFHLPSALIERATTIELCLCLAWATASKYILPLPKVHELSLTCHTAMC